ncbi:MAG: low-specificity L-threonine aldolase [Firmicutes bacterium]|nr:low-specificity L-threonine aldolase [Bacillota bacterium]
MRYIDLRSDTVTVPSEEMRKAMYRAEVGDDVYGEDPSVRRLEELMVELSGKEAALFVTSGTQGNLVALLTHCERGEEVILEAEAHIYYYEVGGMSALGGLIPVRVPGERGVLRPEAVRAAVRGANIHFPKTGLICLENTHNRAGGTVTSIEEMWAVRKVADEFGLPVHLDGARLFKAATALGEPLAAVAAPVDTVSICLSKGLGAPVGSVLCGSRAFIEEARRYRKMLGGGLRQAGVLAAAGIYALQNNVERLAEDHVNARLLAEGLQNIPGIEVDMAAVQTNIVILNVAGTGYSAPQLAARFLEQGLKANATGEHTIRFVTHLNVTKEDCLEALERVRLALAR